MVKDTFLEKVAEHFRDPRGIIWEMIMGEDILWKDWRLRFQRDLDLI